MTRLVRTTRTDRLMRTYYPACGAVLLSQMLGISVRATRQYASRIGVKTRHRGGRPFERGHDPRRGPGRKMVRGVAA